MPSPPAVPATSASPVSRVAGLGDFFPHARVSSASWGTRCVSYPAGAVLAWFCHRLRLGPNAVSFLALTTGIAAAAIAGLLIEDLLTGGIVLLAGLQLAYALDCADGVLARTTGRCSRFGAVLDKSFDAISMALIPGLLCIGASVHHELPALWTGPVILLTVVPRVGVAVVIWLKDLVRHGGSKTAVDERAHTLFWWGARAVAGILDTPVFSLLIAISWATGNFIHFMIGYGIFNTLALALYLFKSSRELDS